MRFDDQLLDRIQSSNDIVDVISQYVPLKKAGRNHKGCCPFHEEKTPSFMVTAEKQIYHCFGCGAGGNVFGFLMRFENMSFPEAVRRLAERAHITLPEMPSSADSGFQKSEKEKLFEAYHLAADFYQRYFQHESFGSDARNYFFGRHFHEDTARELQVGWAPDDWRKLYEYLRKKGFSDELLLKARLISRSEKGNPYDMFRGRLMFPIYNLQGKVVGFGGRVLKAEDGPKYLNSPEHPAFSKRRELYGLHLAKRYIDRDVPRLLVVEGYLDFLRLYECGFKATVATLGTALTEEHVAVLKRFAEEAIVIYDGDKAGEAASIRGLEVFLEGGMNVKLVKMPAGSDPDDYLRKEGAERFQALLDDAQDFFDFKLEFLLKRFKQSDSLGLMKITGEFLETFTKVQSPVLVDRYLRRLAGSVGIDEQSLRIEFQKLKQRDSQRARGARPAPERQPEKRESRAPAEKDQVMVLALMLEDKTLKKKGFEVLQPEDFDDQELSRVFARLRELHELGQSPSPATVLTRLERQDLSSIYTEIACLTWNETDKEQAFEDCLKALRMRHLKKRLEELRREIARAEREGDPGVVAGFMEEYQSVMRQIK